MWQRTNQEGIRQPVVQEEHEIGDNTERRLANRVQISEWPRRQHPLDTREFAVIDVGDGFDV